MDMLALLLSVAGFAALALSMPRHHRDLFGRPPSPRRARALFIAGWVQLIAALMPCIAASGWTIGLTVWFGTLSVAGFAVALVMTLAARRKAHKI